MKKESPHEITITCPLFENPQLALEVKRLPETRTIAERALNRINWLYWAAGVGAAAATLYFSVWG